MEVDKAAMCASEIFSVFMICPFVIRAEAEMKDDCFVNSKIMYGIRKSKEKRDQKELYNPLIAFIFNEPPCEDFMPGRLLSC